MEVIDLADDERHIRELMQAFLSQAGYEVHTFSNGDALMEACRREMPDLVILDIMMPGTDGLSVCTQLRQQNEHLPIIIVSAKDSPYDRVTGLTLGGDDYLIKPFLPLELVARVKALLRRAHPAAKTETPDEWSFGPLALSTARHEATLSGEALALTPTEFDFLAYLMAHQERAVSRDELLHALWQFDWQADTRATDDLLKRLRRKLRERKSPVRIETVWGFGFKLAQEEEKK